MAELFAAASSVGSGDGSKSGRTKAASKQAPCKYTLPAEGEKASPKEKPPHKEKPPIEKEKLPSKKQPGGEKPSAEKPSKGAAKSVYTGGLPQPSANKALSIFKTCLNIIDHEPLVESKHTNSFYTGVSNFVTHWTSFAQKLCKDQEAKPIGELQQSLQEIIVKSVTKDGLVFSKKHTAAAKVFANSKDFGNFVNAVLLVLMDERTGAAFLGILNLLCTEMLRLPKSRPSYLAGALNSLAVSTKAWKGKSASGFLEHVHSSLKEYYEAYYESGDGAENDDGSEGDEQHEESEQASGERFSSEEYSPSSGDDEAQKKRGQVESEGGSPKGKGSSKLKRVAIVEDLPILAGDGEDEEDGDALQVPVTFSFSRSSRSGFTAIHFDVSNYYVGAVCKEILGRIGYDVGKLKLKKSNSK